MRVVIDIEANALVNPTKIWCIVCKDIDTGEYNIFRKVTEDVKEAESFLRYCDRVSTFIGHNYLGYDGHILDLLLPGYNFNNPDKVLDTLILSKLIDYSRKGHSIEDYGVEFGLPKGDFKDFSKYSQEMENYCVRDVDICEHIYRKYSKYIANNAHTASIQLEHRFQLVVNALHDNGFSFNSDKATKLLDKVTAELAVLDKDILEAFPPKLTLIREITPKETKYGTLAKTDFRWLGDADISEYNGGAFCRCSWNDFNPNSHRQIVAVLQSAGWSPIDKTKSHIEVERELGRLRYDRSQGSDLDLRKKELTIRLEELRKTGWQVNENNLDTLPAKAPSAARLLAKRILLESRRRTLTEWLDLVWFTIAIDTSRGIKENATTILNGLSESEVKERNGAATISNAQERLTEKPISNTSMGYRSKMFLEWLKTKKVNAQFAEESVNSTSITVIGRGALESCFALLATVASAGLKQTPIQFKITSERIHGKFNGLGAWSHRMNHQNPNTANIPKEFDTNGKKKLLGKELRQLWCAPKGKLLVGVDAAGIQLRIFAHYINDPEFTYALEKGIKEDSSDPHSLNQRILGSVCKTRDAAKRFIFAYLLGGGIGKLSQILDCSEEEGRVALNNLVGRYSGLASLKETIIPADAQRGWFVGIDGRRVRILGDTVGQRKHLAMSGYLQNGEQSVVKETTIRTLSRCKEEGYAALLVNIVHDEVVIEVPNDVRRAEYVSKIFCQEIAQVGIDWKLNCPLAGEGHVGLNWYEIH